MKASTLVVTAYELPDDRTLTQRNSSSRVRGEASRPVRYLPKSAQLFHITLQCIRSLKLMSS